MKTELKYHNLPTHHQPHLTQRPGILIPGRLPTLPPLPKLSPNPEPYAKSLMPNPTPQSNRPVGSRRRAGIVPTQPHHPPTRPHPTPRLPTNTPPHPKKTQLTEESRSQRQSRSYDRPHEQRSEDFSIATGLSIKSISISTLSPGMHISRRQEASSHLSRPSSGSRTEAGTR